MPVNRPQGRFVEKLVMTIEAAKYVCEISYLLS